MKKINILSLFDGIACGYEALNKAGIWVNTYYASEIDKYAISIALKNHPDIVQLGDVNNIDFTQFIGKIDLIMGGSPCFVADALVMTDCGFKPIKQGKVLQEWVKNNKLWVNKYFTDLFNWSIKNINLKRQTYNKLFKIRLNLFNSIDYIKMKYPKTAIFRYIKGYAEFTKYKSDSELPINIAVKEYQKYIKYKEAEYNKKRGK